MTILVAGFIGSNFVIDWLVGSEEPIVNLGILTYAGNLTNLAALKNDARYMFVKSDIGDSSLIFQLLQQHKPRAVINFAAESHVDRSIHGPQDFIQANIIDTFRLLKSVRGYWSELPDAEKASFRFLHASTDEVYGSLDADTPAFAETNEPNSPYSASRASSDQLVLAYHYTYGLLALIANVTKAAIKAMTATSSWPSETCHLAPYGATIWHGIAQTLFQLAKEARLPFATDESALQAITTAEYPTPAKRPANSRLDTSRLEKQLKFKLPNWKDGFSAVAEEIIKDFKIEPTLSSKDARAVGLIRAGVFA